MVTVSLKCKEIELRPEKVSNIKTFINKYKMKEIIYPSRKMIEKRFRKIIQQFRILLKKKKHAEFI